MEITNDGKLAAQAPLDPKWVYAVDLAKRHRPHCAKHIVAIAALCSSMHSIWIGPRTHQAVGHVTMDSFADPSSDHLTDLNALYAYETVEEKIKDGERLHKWRSSRFLNRRSLNDILHIRDMCVASMGVNAQLNTYGSQDRLDIRWVLARAFFRHTAFISRSADERRQYRTVHGNSPALVEMDSMLSTGFHSWVIYDKFTMSQRPYLETATAIDPAWIVVSYLTTVI
jgi:hypothetical protein